MLALGLDQLLFHFANNDDQADQVALQPLNFLFVVGIDLDAQVLNTLLRVGGLNVYVLKTDFGGVASLTYGITFPGLHYLLR